MTLNSVVCHFT